MLNFAQQTGHGRIRINAAQVVDGDRVDASPGSLLMQDRHIIAAGLAASIGSVDEESTTIIDLPHHAIMPALVNAHCHLDLSHIGNVPGVDSFLDFIDIVRDRRASTDDEIAESVRLGIRLLRAGGTAAVGDIGGAGSLVPLRVMRDKCMAGTSFLEVFGQGERQSLAIAQLQDAIAKVQRQKNGVTFGLQPHAPYSCGKVVYNFAAKTGLPLSTHLAETLEELEFVESATGPLAELLQRLDAWDDTITSQSAHPIDYLATTLRKVPLIAAHLNYAEDAHLELLAGWDQLTVAYCPRASTYFGHEDHRYRDMLDTGIRVALGTDSLMCLDTPDRMSVLDDMRFLFQRDGFDARTLLRMATIDGAIALGIDANLFRLTPGRSAGLIAVSTEGANEKDDTALECVLQNNRAPEWVVSSASAAFDQSP